MKRFDIQLFADEEMGVSSGDADQSTGEVNGDAGQVEEAPDRSAQFDELIKGDYADEYHKRMEQAVSGRVRNLKARNAEYEQIADALAEKYGIDRGNVKGIFEAVKGDNSYIKQLADENGNTESVQAQLNQLRAINARKEAEAQKEKLTKEVQETMSQFPDFDLEREMENPEFIALSQNVGIKRAYMNMHLDDILSGAMAKTAEVVQQKTINNIKAMGMRPSENGATSRAAGTHSIDPSKLTLDEINAYRQRAKNGEVITFRN